LILQEYSSIVTVEIGKKREKMKNKYSVTLVICFLVSLAFLLANQDKYPQWKGTIENENGVKVINNPEDPHYGEIKFDLEEIFMLGAEKSENDLFSVIFDVQADARGNVYVSDIRERRIKKFSSKGEYLYDIGRIGQGPGEFQGARNIYVDDNTGDIYVADFMKVHRYNQNGVFQKTVSINRIFHTFFVGADRSFWAKTSYMDETGQGEAFEKISPQGQLAKRIYKFSPQITESSKPSGEGTVTVVSGPKHGYEQELIVSKIDGKTFLWALSNEYEMNMVDFEGNLLFKIKKQESPEKFSEKEKDKILSKFNDNARKIVKLPPYKPFFKKIISDDEGRIYVQRTSSPLSEKEEYVYDIFSKNGYFLYQSRFSEEPVVIKNALLYTVVRDPETEIQHVKVFRVKNWSSIKKDIPL
jgi:hypothetical protein